MKSVFKFYNKFGWLKKKNITTDSEIFEDNRMCASEYISYCRKRIQKYIPKNGKNFLDFASGPLQYSEYLRYSKNFKVRHCIDFSRLAIKEAKKKLGNKGKYYCDDFMNIKFKKNYFDCSLSMHTLYHINKNKQAKVVNKLIKITKQNKPVIIVYSNPNTLIKKLTFFLKRNKKKGIYFFCHPNDWWKQFNKKADVKIFPWRSFSSQHQKKLIPNNFLGKILFKLLIFFENKFNNFFSENFQYITVVLTKK